MSTWGGKRSGAGRKQKYEGESVSRRTFVLPNSVDDEIKRRAEKQGKSASEIVVETLRRAFRMKPKETNDDDPNDPGAP